MNENMSIAQLVKQDDYEIKNLLLAYPSDWFIEAETLDKVKQSLPALAEFYANDGKDDPQPTPLHDVVTEVAKDVYAVPLFSEKFCALLRDEIANIRQKMDFAPNDEEDELRQIPEVVLQDRIPALHASLMQVVLSVVNPILQAIWNRCVTHGGIQIANYNPKGKQKGAWHHDASADITIVVPLNTGEYEGGGTEFFGRGVVPPLPSGHALIFPALTHLHRGLAVESGDRYLLVFWLKCPT